MTLEVHRFAAGGEWLDIAATEDDAIFATARNGVDRYDIRIDPGFYSIEFLFTETEYAVDEGERVFDISAEDVTVLDDFDILADAGSYRTATRETVEGVSVVDGGLIIRLLTASGTRDTGLLPENRRPELSGIEIWTFTPPPAPTPTPTPTATPGPTPTPTPTPPPVFPTPTPPALNDGPPASSPPLGGGYFPIFRPLAPTPTPTATRTPTPTATPSPTATPTAIPDSLPEPAAPTVAPAFGGPSGGTGTGSVRSSGAGKASGTGSSVVATKVEPPPARVAVAASRGSVSARDVVVFDVTLDAVGPVGGFSILLDLPLEAFEVISVEVPSALTEVGFDGRPQLDETLGRLVLGGGFNAPVLLSSTPVLRVELALREGVEPGIRSIGIVDVVVRDGGRQTMNVVPPSPLAIVVEPKLLADANEDGSIGVSDLDLLLHAYGSLSGAPAFDVRADLNDDGVVDLRDLAILGASYDS